MNCRIVESSEVETDEINFDKLNMPPDHPARGIHGTFYLNNNLLLHTCTSNSQDEDDATHTHQFTQIEGFVVSYNISFSHLKGTLNLVFKELFGKMHPLRFRSSYFPFTEPSIEIFGAGLIHPQVLKSCGFDDQKFTDILPLGLGIERLLMIKYGIEGIRHFYVK
ncbi:8361_t:CDS:2 [Entrophospora sp. SA101]|nr:16867_t:CDS:2 [Entrophospora sp. SA101]CAJ0889454.1 8361_t:CDS:2 [Entrophospora sp. SA101]